MNRRNQRGESKLGCILGLVVFVLAVIVAIRAVPVMKDVYSLDDFARRQAEGASNLETQRIKEEITERILREAQSRRLPLSQEDISVKADRNFVRIEYEYTVEIQILFYTYQWKISREVERPIYVV